MSESTRVQAGKHTELYTRKGLLVKLEGLAAVAEGMVSALGGLPLAANESEPLQPAAVEAELRATLQAYDAAAASGGDEFGKSSFHNAPFGGGGVYYAGRIVPVLHYCMGGLEIDTNGKVKRKDYHPKVLGPGN